MDRRDFIKATGLCTAGIGINGCSSFANKGTARKTTRKPNIIYILTDDMGYGDVSCYGQKKFTTPNIDQLAAEGMKFTQHYSGSCVCAPARCTLMTGLHTGHCYVRNNSRMQNPVGNAALPYEAVTVGELMQRAGYRTGIIGKWGLGGPGSSGVPNKQGFDYFYGFLDQKHAHHYYPSYIWRNEEKVVLEENDPMKQEGTYIHDNFTEEALDFVKKNQQDPFYLYLAYTIPHSDLIAPEDSMKKYRGRFPEPDPYEGGSYRAQKHPRAAFAAMISRMDRDIGRLMKLLKDLNLDDNTLVIFTSDNGTCFSGGNDPEFFNSSGPLRGIKQDLYEGGIRVPMIARWPGRIEAGSVSDHISALWDVMPTFAELVSVQTPPNIDGISMLPTLLGQPEKQKQHEYLYWEWNNKGGRQAIRMGKWKAVRNRIKDDPAKLPELYNLEKDIGEQNNVAGQNPRIVAKMQQLFKDARTLSEVFPMPVEKEKVSFPGL